MPAVWRLKAATLSFSHVRCKPILQFLPNEFSFYLWLLLHSNGFGVFWVINKILSCFAILSWIIFKANDLISVFNWVILLSYKFDSGRNSLFPFLSFRVRVLSTLLHLYVIWFHQSRVVTGWWFVPVANMFVGKTKLLKVHLYYSTTLLSGNLFTNLSLETMFLKYTCEIQIKRWRLLNQNLEWRQVKEERKEVIKILPSPPNRKLLRQSDRQQRRLIQKRIQLPQHPKVKLKIIQHQWWAALQSKVQEPNKILQQELEQRHHLQKLQIRKLILRQ